jgi:phosphohistidine phosphatase
MPSLYLIRHGIAEDRENYEDDTQRPLTDEGRKKTKQV